MGEMERAGQAGALQTSDGKIVTELGREDALLLRIYAAIDRNKADVRAYEDAFSCIRNMGDAAGRIEVDKAHELRQRVSEGIKLARDRGDLSAYDRLFDLNKRTMCYTAPDCLDDFLLYNEIHRKPQEQFWLPRRRKLMRVCQALQDMEDGKLDELFLSCPPRIGKALADDTPVLTRSGWKNHGELVVGDEVVGLDGKFKKVLAVHPKCELDVKVEFTNGESVICHENHEWRIFDRACRKTSDYETKRMMRAKPDCCTPGKRGHRYRFQLPARECMAGEEKDLPLDPYTLGVWLGDGTGTNPTICNAPADRAIIDRVVRNGNEARWHTTHKTTGVEYYGFGFRDKLKKYGMCLSRKRAAKYIPDDYLTASVQQRLDLLAGLLDTDGTYVPKEKRYCFATCEAELRDTFIQLVSTFGWRVSIAVHPPVVSSSGVVGRKEVYYIAFSPDMEIPCSLARKQNKEFGVRRAIAVKRISRVAPVTGNCITVEGDGMYLIGRTMVPTHNSTLMLMFFLWVMGRDSERSNLYCSYTDSVVGVLYNGVLEMLNDPVTYAFFEVFPAAKIASTNAKDLLINLDRKKRYASFTGRSLYGTLNGACDCNGYLVGDDLISGIEEAMSKDRLKAAWDKVDNNLLPRAKETAKILWIGTRWSLLDPQGKRIDLLENDPKYAGRRWKVLNTPALNEKDESNFEYEFGVGFSTDYYQQRRASFERNSDLASWLAQYQGEPIERDGAVFDPDGLRYFNGVLPEGEPDRVFMTVDPAYGGGDYTAAPVAVQYGDDLYIVDVVFDNGEKNVTQPLIVNAVKKYGVQAMKVEGTKMTASYGEEIDKMLRDDGVKVNMQINTKHFTGTGKRTRIFDKAPDIREHMIFLSDGNRSKAYSRFMQNMYSFTVTGKSAKHDDAADSCAMCVDFAFFGGSSRIEVFRRPF